MFLFVVGIITVFGALMRFYRVNQSDFIFYDEGYYLNYNRFFYDILFANKLATWDDYRGAVWAWVRLCLGSGKALWFMISDLRLFFGGYKAWYIPRVLSAFAGLLTMWVTYLFSRKFFNSKWVAGLSVALLALLPSHVFYSRLGLQESFSTFCFISGFYLYLFPRKFGVRTFLAGALFACSFFSNYRLITLPVHVAFCEIFVSVAERRLPSFRKYLWCILTFFSFVFIVGNLDQAQNTVLTFAWMFYQSSLAKKQLALFNFLSFPYYLFRLENLLFGLAFFGNIYYLVKKKFIGLFPFAMVCLQMFIYSFAGEKGARYLAVVIPFMVMAVASLIVYLFFERKKRYCRVGLVLLAIMMLSGLAHKSFRLCRTHSNYRGAMAFIKEKDPQAKSIATQNFVLNLYTENQRDVEAFPYRFQDFMMLSGEGYRYLIVDPQAYISWTEEMERFNPKLITYLGFIERSIKPVKVLDNFSDEILERFVFDHNENLRRSIDFLKNNDGFYGKIRIYDIRHCLAVIDQLVGLENVKGIPDYESRNITRMYGR